MSDREEALDSGRDDADTAANSEIPSNVAAFPTDDSPTDARLPKLTVPMAATTASGSLGRLESDLRRLQAKWRAVEQDMCERDQRIVELTASIEDYKQKLGALESELKEATESGAELAGELDAASEDRDRWKDQVAETEREIASREAKIEEAQKERDELRQEKDALARRRSRRPR